MSKNCPPSKFPETVTEFLHVLFGHVFQPAVGTTLLIAKFGNGTWRWNHFVYLILAILIAVRLTLLTVMVFATIFWSRVISSHSLAYINSIPTLNLEGHDRGAGIGYVPHPFWLGNTLIVPINHDKGVVNVMLAEVWVFVPNKRT